MIAYWGQGYGGWSHVDVFDRDGWLVGARSDVIKGFHQVYSVVRRITRSGSGVRSCRYRYRVMSLPAPMRTYG